MTFADRQEAGERLATGLAHLKEQRPLVLGLARGGVEVAAQIVAALETPLDVLVVRKVGAPWQPEYGIGAVAPDGTKVFEPALLDQLGVSEADFDLLAAREVEELQRRLQEYRGGKADPQIRGRCVILVDDGVATGITALAAVRYARKLEPAHLVFAVPVTSRQARALLEPEVDEFVAIVEPFDFRAVGQWYEDFAQTTDEEVNALLLTGRQGGGYVA